MSLRELATRRVKPSNLFVHPTNYRIIASKANGSIFANVNEKHLTRNQIINSGILTTIRAVLKNKNFSNPRYIHALELYEILHEKVYGNNPNAAPARLIVMQHAIPYLEYLNNIGIRNELRKIPTGKERMKARAAIINRHTRLRNRLRTLIHAS